MDTIQLTPETVASYKHILLNPQKYNLPFKAITEYFEKSEQVTASHKLAYLYLTHIARPVPKMILYIIMNEIYGHCNAKDEKGDLGYYLKFVE